MDAFASADKWADYLKNVEKCDLVIALTHLGYSGYPDQANDVALAKDSENIDIIIGGHSHTFLKTDRVYKNRVGRDVVVVQAGAASTSTSSSCQPSSSRQVAVLFLPVFRTFGRCAVFPRNRPTFVR